MHDLLKIKAIAKNLIHVHVTNVYAFMALTRYIKGYAKIIVPLFELTKRDIIFKWVPICQGAFDTLRKTLIKALILYWPNFNKAFILNINWSTQGVGTIFS
jgi:hypothetical protein